MRSVRSLRLVGIVEGISFLLLLFVAMPLKYVFDQPMAVRVAGMLHGVLFVAFVALLVMAAIERSWSLRTAGLLLGSSLVPFGFLAIDKLLQREIEAAQAELAS